MESTILNNNQRSFAVVSNGKQELIIRTIKLFDDSSFLTHSQSLRLKVYDSEAEFSKRISEYPMKDDTGQVAEINEKFTDFKELIVEVIDDNPLLSGQLNFNLEVDYDLV